MEMQVPVIKTRVQAGLGCVVATCGRKRVVMCRNHRESLMQEHRDAMEAMQYKLNNCGVSYHHGNPTMEQVMLDGVVWSPVC